ncbi:MAPEG family protein [Aspergillus affinis]|uniref:MAPEG family protein n=1 Tax=Aspergillus affinis TaxID=1070780 RepID=UPI0022FDF8A3|nr:uncharacterized protein KD926_011146 [Aspergillus affinis]KAI9038207.1 hypothetical protein KD926_011146 [Aspergillus affinis]
MTLLTALGLSASPPTSPVPNYAPYALIFNFVWAYGLLSSRTLKQYYGIDHNVSPRQDLRKYGAAAVSSGKITQKQLDRLHRNEAAHANAVENYTLLVGAVSMASWAGVESTIINRSVAVYTLARLAHAAVYIGIDRSGWSQLRGICWWIGNLSCLGLLWRSFPSI